MNAKFWYGRISSLNIAVFLQRRRTLSSVNTIIVISWSLTVKKLDFSEDCRKQYKVELCMLCIGLEKVEKRCWHHSVLNCNLVPQHVFSNLNYCAYNTKKKKQLLKIISFVPFFHHLSPKIKILLKFLL